MAGSVLLVESREQPQTGGEGGARRKPTGPPGVVGRDVVANSESGDVALRAGAGKANLRSSNQHDDLGPFPQVVGRLLSCAINLCRQSIQLEVDHLDLCKLRI